jgi:hypothetical protein
MSLPSALAPKRPSPVLGWGLLLAGLLTAAGVVLLEDVACRLGLVQRSWLVNGVTGLNGLTPRFWMIVLGAVLFLLGLWMLVSALSPRGDACTRVQSGEVDLWIGRSDAARLAASAARKVPGVVDASAKARRSAIRLHLETTGASEGTIVPKTQEVVLARLDLLEPTPNIRVTTRKARS